MTALIVVLIIIVIAAGVKLVSLAARNRVLEQHLTNYHHIVLEWTLYLHDKSNREDFDKWTREMKRERP